MALVTWDQSYSVKVSKCDDDHKKLFSLLNALHDAMKMGKGSQVVAQTVKDLADYAKYHFSREEMLLRQTNYPKLIPHQEQHQTFVNKVQEFQSDLKAGDLTQSITVLEFLKDWLASHIKQADRQYSDHLNANGIS
ncbi:MAG TPA: bacteriohemerythrin [Candidatus Binatia bacterium]|nr:bacteriohemerythrin [Candidatus Binatia bacterium]